MDTYKNDLISMFSKYGFIRTPLSNHMIKTLYRRGVDLNAAYCIGCDVYAGYSFKSAVEALNNDQI